MGEAENDVDRIARWVDQTVADLDGPQLVDHFGTAFGRLWARTQQTLGETMLAALSERVIRAAREVYPLAAACRVEATGIVCRQLREHAGKEPREELLQALRFMLLEWVKLLGQLTGNVLTPILATELARLPPPPLTAAGTPRTGEATDAPSALTIPRIATHIPNLDALLNGGIPTGSLIAITGPPGSGKTILSQQICFANAAPERRALFFSTLSEPPAKRLRHLIGFTFFDAGIFAEAMRFVDLSDIMRERGLEGAKALILEQIEHFKPTLVIVDSMKAFTALAKSQGQMRRFDYELALAIMAWNGTAFLIGEYTSEDFQSDPLFSITDGLINLWQEAEYGEQRRFIQIRKLRDTAHSLDVHAFTIDNDGLRIFAPRLSLARCPLPAETDRMGRLKTNVSKLDLLLGAGIPQGSSILVSGSPGTGKTLLLLEFIYRGARECNEPGLFITFQETADRVLASARSLGWELEREIERGMVEILAVPQPSISVDADLIHIQERVVARKVRRVALDSVTTFLHRIEDALVYREKVFQLASIVYNNLAVGFFADDVPYGGDRISRFGIEENVVDGVILLSLEEEGIHRERYIEVYKLRNTAHLNGRHSLAIGPQGIRIFPRYLPAPDNAMPIGAFDPGARLPTGIPGFDAILDGGFLAQSVTLVSGSAGTGKSTLCLQFIIEGAKRGERGVFFTLEEDPLQVQRSARALGLSLDEALAQGLVEVVSLAREQNRAGQLPATLSDRIVAFGARRLALDGATFIESVTFAGRELQYLLHTLGAHFKSLGVTSVFTLDSEWLFSTEQVTNIGLSPASDNLILLRYARIADAFIPTVTVVKTRGSHHQRQTFVLELGRGGLRIGERIGALVPTRRAQKRWAS